MKTIFTLQKKYVFFSLAVLKHTRTRVFIKNCFEKYSEVQALNYSTQFSKEMDIQQ